MVQGYPGQAGIWFQGDPEVIKDYLEFNPVGIVTNTLVLDGLVDTYGPMLGVIERYLELDNDGPVVVEVDGDTTEDIVSASAPFQALSERVVMKIPSTSKGFRAIARMKANGRESMVTTLFSASQAVRGSPGWRHLHRPIRRPADRLRRRRPRHRQRHRAGRPRPRQSAVRAGRHHPQLDCRRRGLAGRVRRRGGVPAPL